MRISFLLSSLWLSGGVRVVVEYANRLSERGHVVTLVIPKGTNDADMARELSPKVAVVSSTICRHESMNLLQRFHLTFSLARAVPPSDVVIATHTPTTLSSLIATFFLRRGCPVWLYQDYRQMFIGRPIEDWLLRYAAKWHRVTLVVSEYCAQELKQYGAKEITVIGEGLSHAQTFRPVAFAKRPSEDRYTILFLGDMRPRKGLYDLLEAANLVYQQLPIKLWIVSKEVCKIETHLPYQLIYRPNRRELADLYGRCHVFVSASWWESFGLPPLEAMACAAPVVLTDSGGVREYAQPETNCVMTSPRNPQKLAEALLRVLTDDTLANRLSQQGPPTAGKYSWAAAVDRFEAALSTLAI